MSETPQTASSSKCKIDLAPECPNLSADRRNTVVTDIPYFDPRETPEVPVEDLVKQATTAEDRFNFKEFPA